MREEEKKQPSQWKKFLKKRWVFPAIYLVSAALLISGIFIYQAVTKDIAKGPGVNENANDLIGKDEEPVVEVNQTFENVAMPVKNDDEVNIITEFFDSTASQEKQEAALIVNGNQYRPSMGIDIAMKDGSEFEVVAALSGKVTSVREDALLGNVIEIEHDKEVTTIYQSIKDFQVKEGDTVKQGAALATSNTSQLNPAAKNHVHFEIRKENKALNPLTFVGQPLTALETALDTKKETSSEEAGEATESNTSNDVSEEVKEFNTSDDVNEEVGNSNSSEETESSTDQVDETNSSSLEIE